MATKVALLAMLDLLKQLHCDETGGSGIEYGLILCLMVMVMLIGLDALGHATVGDWNYVSSQVTSGIAQANS